MSCKFNDIVYLNFNRFIELGSSILLVRVILTFHWNQQKFVKQFYLLEKYARSSSSKWPRSGHTSGSGVPLIDALRRQFLLCLHNFWYSAQSSSLFTELPSLIGIHCMLRQHSLKWGYFPWFHEIWTHHPLLIGHVYLNLTEYYN